MPLIAITTVQITFMANDHSVSGHFLHVAASHGVVPAFHYYASPSLVKLTARLAALYTAVHTPVAVLINVFWLPEASYCSTKGVSPLSSMRVYWLSSLTT